MKKIFVSLLILAVAGVVGWQVYVRLSERAGDKGPKRGGADAIVAVEVAPITKTAVSDRREFTGSLVAKSMFTVCPRVGGRIKKLHADIGDRVERGAPIAELDDEEYRLKAEQVEAELTVAIANVDESASALEAAKREFERIEALSLKRIASESELDAASAQYKAKLARDKVARAQVEQKKAALAESRVRLDDTKVKAVWEGDDSGFRTVGERFVHEGAIVVANTPLVTVMDISTILAVIFVPEKNYTQVQKGQKAVIATEAMPGKTFEGTIARIAPMLKESSRKAQVEIEVPNPDFALKPGMFVRAVIEFERREGATVVPFISIVNRDGEQGVFLADLAAKKASFVRIKPGIQQENFVEVLDPPISGSVVITGQHFLRDGSGISLAQGGGGDRPGREGSAGGQEKRGGPRREGTR